MTNPIAKIHAIDFWLLNVQQQIISCIFRPRTGTTLYKKYIAD